MWFRILGGTTFVAIERCDQVSPSIASDFVDLAVDDGSAFPGDHPRVIAQVKQLSGNARRSNKTGFAREQTGKLVSRIPTERAVDEEESPSHERILTLAESSSPTVVSQPPTRDDARSLPFAPGRRLETARSSRLEASAPVPTRANRE